MMINFEGLLVGCRFHMATASKHAIDQSIVESVQYPSSRSERFHESGGCSDRANPTPEKVSAA